MNKFKENHYLIHFLGNTSGVFFVCLLLLFAFGEQLILGELPCPLCLLQRIAFVSFGVALSMNLIIGVRSSHYAMAILSAGVGVLIALRQALLHILPNDPGFGSVILGKHAYTWNVIIFFFLIMIVALALLFTNGVNTSESKLNPPIKKIAKVIVLLFGFIILANILSAFLECGLKTCPDDPVEYEFKLLNR